MWSENATGSVICEGWGEGKGEGGTANCMGFRPCKINRSGCLSVSASGGGTSSGESAADCRKVSEKKSGFLLPKRNGEAIMSPRRPAFLRLSVMRDIIATLFASQRPPKNTGYWLRLTVILKARDRKVSTTVSLGAPMTYSCSILSESSDHQTCFSETR